MLPRRNAPSALRDQAVSCAAPKRAQLEFYPLFADALRFGGGNQYLAQFGFAFLEFSDPLANVAHLVGRKTVGTDRGTTHLRRFARRACRKTLVRGDVAAKLAIVRSRRDVISHQARFEIEQGRLDPIAVASVGQQRDGKVEPLLEGRGVLAVAVQEKAAVLAHEALLAQ